jgi:hypothetical protein
MNDFGGALGSIVTWGSLDYIAEGVEKRPRGVRQSQCPEPQKIAFFNTSVEGFGVLFSFQSLFRLGRGRRVVALTCGVQVLGPMFVS